MSTTDRSNSESHRSNSESHRRISVGMEIDDSDHPPESIVVPITEDTPWHILAYDSGESTREITNPKSQSSHCPWSRPVSSSRQIAAANLNATAQSPIISIRTKMKLPSFAHRHSRPSIFPSWRSNRSKKSGLSYSEPGSPKVSCWGKVLSEREKEKVRQRREGRKELTKASSCCSRFSAALNCVGDRDVRRRHNSQLQLAEVHPAHVQEVQRSPEENIVSDAAIKVQEASAEVIDHPAHVEEVQQPPEPNIVSDVAIEVKQSCVKAEAVELGALKRYSSGRRAESWGADLVDVKEGIAAVAQENILS